MNTDTGEFMARGNALLSDKDLRLGADEIRYDPRRGIAFAKGNVQLTRKNLRLLADEISYNIQTEVFTAENFRVGLPPIIIEGNKLQGSSTSIVVVDGVFYYGEPGPFTLRVAAMNLEILPNSVYRVRNARFALGSIPFIGTGSFSSDVRGRPLSIDGTAGYRSRLGLYTQTTITTSIWDGVDIGANLDLYTSRGILIGPAANYFGEWGDAEHSGELSTGWIYDLGDVEISELYPGVTPSTDPDIRNRGFILWRNRTRILDSLEAVAVVNYQSDADALRDFRNDIFNENQDPDNYANITWFQDPWVLSLFTRFRLNDFQNVVERLPEMRADLPWTPFFATDALQRAHVAAAYLKWDPDPVGGLFPQLDTRTPITNDAPFEQGRIDAGYGLLYPIPLAEGVTFTPKAAARGLAYTNTRDEGSNRDTEYRSLGELGFDVNATISGEWDYVNEYWDIHGIRHLIIPTIEYRYRTGDSLDASQILPVDFRFQNVHKPPTDILDERGIDVIDPDHFLRLGVGNTWATQTQEGINRTLARANIFYDWQLEDQRYLQNFNAVYTELFFSPAAWIELDIYSKFDADQSTLDSLSSRLTLRSGDLWSLSLLTAYLDDEIEQFSTIFRYKLSERFSFNNRLRYDVRRNGYAEHSYSIGQRLGNNIQIEYGVRFASQSDREDDFGIAFRARFVEN